MPSQNPAPPEESLPPGEHASRAEMALLEPGEHLVTIVHRHPIGIIAIYLEALVGVVALMALAVIVAPDFLGNLSGESYRLFLGGVFMATVLLALVLFVATYIYRQSKLLVTDKNLVQIIQRGLFIRKVSRLSMSNVEDVTAEHRGILSTIFNYGTLLIQTAGEMENFRFPWCPTPDLYADRILEARQKYALSLDDPNHRDHDSE